MRNYKIAYYSFILLLLFVPQHLLRVSFSSGRDRVHRHCCISPFRTPSGLSLLSLFFSLLTPPRIRNLVVGRFGKAILTAQRYFGLLYM